MKSISIGVLIALLSMHHIYGFSTKVSKKQHSKETAIPSDQNTPEALSFTMSGPKGWHTIDDPAQLPTRVKVVYVGKGKGGFTPSLNLAMENTTMEVQEYFSLAKNYHETQPDTRCSHLGKLQTKSGDAELLQIDRKTAFGDVRFLQAIIVKNQFAYVITATALIEEYGMFYTQFFNTIQSFSLKDAR